MRVFQSLGEDQDQSLRCQVPDEVGISVADVAQLLRLDEVAYRQSSVAADD